MYKIVFGSEGILANHHDHTQFPCVGQHALQGILMMFPSKPRHAANIHE